VMPGTPAIAEEKMTAQSLGLSEPPAGWKE
jgi:hypothetical protein